MNLSRPGTQETAAPMERAPDPWDGLRTLIRVRLVVATLALPVGVLLHPSADDRAIPVLWGSLIAVGVLSALFALGVRLQRALVVQTYVQIAIDLLLVGAIAAATGGRESQFVLFFALIVITGGLFGRVPGGSFAAAGACGLYLLLPWMEGMLGYARDASLASQLPGPALILAFWVVVGVLAGILGERVRRTRHDLERTARELDRLRIDNDLILRHLTTGVLTVSGRGEVAYLNPAGEQMLALRSLELRGRLIEQSMPERLWPLRDLVLETLERGVARTRVEVTLRTPGGRAVPVGATINPLAREDGPAGVVAVFQDLSEVREMERRARRNETLAEVGALAAGIAHELRNGLNPISGSAEHLQREVRLEGENAVLMELIVRECARLNRFVTDLLNYSRERDLAPEDLDLDAQLAELRGVIERDPRCVTGTRVVVDSGLGGRRARADREAIRQVWLNLAANALEAMPAGGTLTLRGSEGENDLVVAEFEDTGTGIAAADLPRVGEPFFTTKRGGTGLGLAIAQRIVERHGGTLAVESQPGRGTTVRVTLPGVTAGVAQAA